MTSSSFRVILPGGSGQVGNILARHFHSQGHEVVVFSRRMIAAPWRVVVWDGKTVGDWTRELEAADLVINLSGKSVNCRYNARNRGQIMNSRIQSTRIIGEAIHSAVNPPRIWMNSSTATIYRHSFDRPMDEFTGELGGHEGDVPRSWRFSTEVAKRWEQSFFSIATSGTRKIALRSAMIMSADKGGIFDTLLRLVRFGLGGTPGSGRQFVSWIHHDDFVRAIEYLMARTEMDGVVNLASPHPLPSSEFMSALRNAWGTRVGLPAYEWMLEIGAVLLGTETELILKSRRVVPGRLMGAGFEFHFSEWPTAAQNLVAQWCTQNKSKN